MVVSKGFKSFNSQVNHPSKKRSKKWSVLRHSWWGRAPGEGIPKERPKKRIQKAHKTTPYLSFKLVAFNKTKRRLPKSPRKNTQFELPNGSFQGLQKLQFIGQSPFKEIVSFEAFLMGSSTRGRHLQTKAQKKVPNSPQNNTQFELQNAGFQQTPRNCQTNHNTTDKWSFKIGRFQGLQDLQFIGQSPFKEMVSFEAFLMGESTRGRHSQTRAQKKDPTSTQNNPQFELQNGGLQQTSKKISQQSTTQPTNWPSKC